MDKLSQVIAYLLDKYPKKEDLSNARVTKMVYLSDWRHAIKTGKQITDINWYFDHYGPYVHDIYNCAKRYDCIFFINDDFNSFGAVKKILSLKKTVNYDSLSSDEEKILDHVIEHTKDLRFPDFIKLVYSTHPILTSDRYSHLDLVEMAIDFNNRKRIEIEKRNKAQEIEAPL